MEGFKNIIAEITNSQAFVILTHERPDGDALGSQLALKLILEKLGKTAIAAQAILPENLSYLPAYSHVVSDFNLLEIDCVIIVDANTVERTGWQNIKPELAERKFLILDHHQGECQKDLCLIDSSASSAGEIVFKLAKALNIEIDKDIATCLLTSLSTDTGSFIHSNTTPQVLKITSELLSAGANLEDLSANIYQKKEVETLLLWGRILKSMKFDENSGIVYSYVSQKDLDEVGGSWEDLEGAINLLNAVPEARYAVLLSERADGIKASLRTNREDVDLSLLAKQFGGGGHRKAAGFNLSFQTSK